MIEKIKHYALWAKYYALWTPFVIIPVGLLIIRLLSKNYKFSFTQLLLLFGASVIVSLIIYSDNYIKAKNGKKLKDMHFVDAFSSRPDKYAITTGKREARIPDVDSKLLVDGVPQGVIFGKDKVSDKYIAKLAGEEGNVLYCGGSGSGKTQMLMPSILAMRADDRTYDVAHMLIVDPKLELTEKVVGRDINGNWNDDGTIIFDMTDRHSYGYDPLYVLNAVEHPSENQIYLEMKNIIEAILPISQADGETAFWKSLAQSVSIGAFVFYYKRGKHTLSDIVTAFIFKPLSEVVMEVCNNSDTSSKECKICNAYRDMPDDTIGSIQANLRALEVYALDDNVVWQLSVNPNKFSPLDLLHTNIHLCVDPKQLQANSSIIMLIISQTIQWMLTLEDYDRITEPRKPIYIIFEEFTSVISSMHITMPDIIVTMLQYARSKKCYLLLVCQSLSGLLAISNNNKDLVNSALSNFSYLCFLDCFSPDSAQMVIDYVGKYDKKNVTTTRSGNSTSTQTSFEEADILNKNDLIKLAGSDELILISRIGGYNMIKKIAAWSDDNFSYRLH